MFLDETDRYRRLTRKRIFEIDKPLQIKMDSIDDVRGRRRRQRRQRR